MAEEIRIAQPKEYYKAFLEKEVRPDNRELGEFRPTVLNIGCISTAEGSSLVKLGNTTVICGVKAEVAEPRADKPKDGYIVPNVELSPLSSPKFRPGPPPEQAQVLSQNMADFIANTQCVKSESLCISPGKLVWVLHIDLVCLDYDGNVMDACTLALMAALKNTSLPEMSVDEESGEVKCDPSSHSMLPVACLPISTTFIIFDNSVLLVDPTREEELLATGAVTVVTEGQDLCSILKPGGSPLSDEQMQLCVERAFTRGREATALITDTLCSVDR